MGVESERPAGKGHGTAGHAGSVARPAAQGRQIPRADGGDRGGHPTKQRATGAARAMDARRLGASMYMFGSPRVKGRRGYTLPGSTFIFYLNTEYQVIRSPSEYHVVTWQGTRNHPQAVVREQFFHG